jgi:protein-tyrosine kinase
MSRLEEALRRSNESPTASAAPRSHKAGVFESPWELGQEDGGSNAAPASTNRAVEPAAPPQPGAAGLLAHTTTPGLSSNWQQWLVTPEVDPTIGEQFRKLAATLLHGQRDGRLKVVMVTSAVPNEGKTLTTLNIALVLAESYKRRVLLIDADLRRPRLTEAANLAVAEGLSEVLKATEDRKAALTQLTDYLWFLPAGRPDPDPLSGLTSPRMQHLLQEAAERFDWVIVDTPPVTAAADAGLLGAIVDGIVLVVRAGRTPHPAVQQAIETLGRDRIFGVVLNGVNRELQEDYSVYAPVE